jgi:hypothetical protein
MYLNVYYTGGEERGRRGETGGEEREEERRGIEERGIEIYKGGRRREFKEGGR